VGPVVWACTAKVAEFKAARTRTPGDAGRRHGGGEFVQRLAGIGASGQLSKWNGKPSKKGTGFERPLAAHQHWHIDVSYINISGTFYYLCGILDGCSRYIVNWDLRESMTEADIEIILERAKELHPEARPRIISDNGPQFIAKDFKEFIRISGMTHVRTSPYYPPIERKNRALA
jgi:putative transposase